MANVTRVSGGAEGVVNMDIGLAGATTNGIIIATGIGKHPVAFKVTANADVSSATCMGINGPVESILRAMANTGTVLMYQVDTTVVSVLMESIGANDTVVTASINAQPTGNTAIYGAWQPVTCVSTAGFKL